MMYYDSIARRVVSVEMLRLRGVVQLIPQVLEAAGIYLLKTVYPDSFDPTVNRLVVEGDPIFQDGAYYQYYAVEPISAEETQTQVAGLKVEALAKIDAMTSTKILAGFDYNINGVQYHIPYDLYDQQNFADTDNARLPSVQWKVLRDGVAESITLTNAEFHDLYVNGAIQFKFACLAEGRQLKQQAEAATDVQTLKDLLAGLEG